MLTFVVGLTSEDASHFETIKQTLLSITAKKTLAADLEVMRMRDAGVWASYQLKKHPLTVHSIARADFHDESYEQLADEVGVEPYKFVVLNEKTIDVMNAHGIGLPPVLGRLESSELPANLNTELNTLYPELVQL
jgi:hypothetical protein